MVAVKGYSYEEFCRGIYERDGDSCWVRDLLIGRRRAKIAEWGAGQGHGLTPTEQGWIPNGLLRCDGELDGHHVVSKEDLGDIVPLGECLKCARNCSTQARRCTRGGNCVPEGGRDLAAALNDPRNGVCVCRRHHDLIERKLIVVRRGDLPPEVEEFAAELGERAVARLERDFGRAPVFPVELRTGG